MAYLTTRTIHKGEELFVYDWAALTNRQVKIAGVVMRKWGLLWVHEGRPFFAPNGVLDLWHVWQVDYGEGYFKLDPEITSAGVV